MAVIICIAGAVVGLIIGTVSGWLVLPMVLQSLEERLRAYTHLPLPAALRDVRRLRVLIIAVYRYVMPLVFAWVGGVAGYYLFIADAP
jgi:hypothetical protein